MNQVPSPAEPPPTSLWRAEDIALWQAGPRPAFPLIDPAGAPRQHEGLDLWDMWPLALPDGSKADVLGGVIWMVLSAPIDPDPDLRHDRARIRLFWERDGVWRDLGATPDPCLGVGEREWSGSAILDSETGVVSLFYTRAGCASHPERKFDQQLMQRQARLLLDGGYPRLTDWSAPDVVLTADQHRYADPGRDTGTPGFISGFRDPGYFRDPADGQEHLLFTASSQEADVLFNGVIGRAVRDERGAWRLAPPLIDAVGVCHELERPHIVAHQGLYYLFWSSQGRVFNPAVAAPPTGLFGMAAPTFLGPYRPLNGSGLVAGNPEDAPTQGYCWWVSADLSVASFVDHWRPGGSGTEVEFGGRLAPPLRLRLEGYRASVERD